VLTEAEGADAWYAGQARRRGASSAGAAKRGNWQKGRTDIVGRLWVRLTWVSTHAFGLRTRATFRGLPPGSSATNPGGDRANRDLSGKAPPSTAAVSLSLL